jgi:hypothetical protein
MWVKISFPLGGFNPAFSKRKMLSSFLPLPLSPSTLTQNMAVGMSHGDRGEDDYRSLFVWTGREIY